MVEALICCILGLSIGYGLASVCLNMVYFYYKQEKEPFEAHVVGIVALWFTTLITSFVRAKFGASNPAIQRGTFKE